MGRPAPDGSQTGIICSSDVGYRMIPDVPGFRRIHTESRECALEDAAVGLAQSLSLRNKNCVHPVRNSKLANLFLLHSRRTIRDDSQLDALGAETGQHVRRLGEGP